MTMKPPFFFVKIDRKLSNFNYFIAWAILTHSLLFEVACTYRSNGYTDETQRWKILETRKILFNIHISIRLVCVTRSTTNNTKNMYQGHVTYSCEVMNNFRDNFSIEWVYFNT